MRAQQFPKILISNICLIDFERVRSTDLIWPKGKAFRSRKPLASPVKTATTWWGLTFLLLSPVTACKKAPDPVRQTGVRHDATPSALNPAEPTAKDASARPASLTSTERLIVSYAPFEPAAHICPFMVGDTTVFCEKRGAWPEHLKTFRVVRQIDIVQKRHERFVEDKCRIEENCFFSGDNTSVFDSAGQLKQVFTGGATAIDVNRVKGEITAVRMFEIDERLRVIKVSCYGSGANRTEEVAFCREDI